jgi:hypothetical protein
MSWDVKANITGEDKDLRSKLKGAEQEVEKTSKNMAGHFEKALGGNYFGSLLTRGIEMAGLGAVAALADRFAEKFNERIKSTRLGTLRTGLDADTFQRFSNLSEASDLPGDAIARSMDHVAEAQQAVLEGGEKGVKAMENFGRLGVSSTDAQKKSFQDLTIQIFRYLQTVEITGEKLTALKAVFGKMGPELIPAMKAGLDSATATKGNIDEGDIANASRMKKATAESDAVAADFGNTLGAVWNTFKQGAKAIPNIFNLEAYKTENSGDYEQRTRAEFARDDLAKKDADRARVKAAEDQQKMVEAGQREDVAKATAKALPGLQSKFNEMQGKDSLASMSPGERRRALEDQLGDAQSKRDLLKKMFDSTGNQEAQRQYLQQGVKAFDIQEQLRQLDKQSRGAPDAVHDSLARIGGGYLAADQVPAKLDEISQGIKDLVSEVKTNNAVGEDAF